MGERLAFAAVGFVGSSGCLHRSQRGHAMSPVHRFACFLLAGAVFACGEESPAPTAPEADLASAAATAPVYTQVVAGGRHSCAIASNGQTYCWGAVALGAGASVFKCSKPVRVLGNHRFVQISAGTEHTCGVTAENRAYCWGDNFYGQLGDGTSANSRSTPVAVAGGRLFRTSGLEGITRARSTSRTRCSAGVTTAADSSGTAPWCRGPCPRRW
jgi:hypothetical protein